MLPCGGFKLWCLANVRRLNNQTKQGVKAKESCSPNFFTSCVTRFLRDPYATGFLTPDEVFVHLVTIRVLVLIIILFNDIIFVPKMVKTENIF